MNTTALVAHSSQCPLIDSFRTADLVQDLYLRELKAYKPTPVKASDAEGQVQKFSAPQPPQSPEEADIASELSAYETQEVEVEGQSTEAGAAPVEQDWCVSSSIATDTSVLTLCLRFDESELADEEPAHH